MTNLNLGSLVLGLIAWFIPVVCLAKRKKSESKNWIVYPMSSISACAISIFLQILYQNHLVNIEDWSAISDTTHGVAVVSAILLVVTLVLNIITLAKYRKK